MGTPVVAIKCSEKYEFEWTILNWEVVQKSSELILNQKLVFETGLSNNVKTKWLFGLKISNNKKYANINIMLDQVKGTVDTLTVNVSTHIVQTWGIRVPFTETTRKVKLGDVIEYNSDKLPIHGDISHPEALKLLIKLEVFLPEYPVISMDSTIAILTPVLSTLAQNVSLSMKGLLNDETSADVTIKTSDGQTIHAHNLILKAQCPTLYSFIQAELVNIALLESSTVHKSVALSGISAKTLKLFLQYWYTGNLSKNCFKAETIVEFTNFAGKFKMLPLLAMLDSTLGKIETTITYSHVQLLDLIQKLQLKNAEAHLLERIIQAVNRVETGKELFKYFVKMNKWLTLTLNFLQIMNEIVDQKDATHKDVLLLAAVEKQGLSKLETLILEHVIKATNKVQSVDELFDLFGYKKQYNCEIEGDLLVRKE